MQSINCIDIEQKKECCFSLKRWKDKDKKTQERIRIDKQIDKTYNLLFLDENLISTTTFLVFSFFMDFLIKKEKSLIVQTIEYFKIESGDFCGTCTLHIKPYNRRFVKLLIAKNFIQLDFFIPGKQFLFIKTSEHSPEAFITTGKPEFRESKDIQYRFDLFMALHYAERNEDMMEFALNFLNKKEIIIKDELTRSLFK